MNELRLRPTLRYIIIPLMLFIGMGSLQAQVENDTIDFYGGDSASFYLGDIFSLDLSDDIQFQLLPLDTIIAIAFANSPTLRFHQAEVRSAREDVLLAKRSWHNQVNVFYSHSFGSQNVLLANIGNMQNTSYTQGYVYGFTISLPLSTFTETPVRIRKFKAELGKYEARVDEAKLNLRKMVIQYYWNLITSQRMMKHSSEDVQAQNLAASIAEIEFRNGNMEAPDYSRIKNLQAIAKNTYEGRLQEFAVAYYSLEAIVGVEIYKLKRIR